MQNNAMRTFAILLLHALLCAAAYGTFYKLGMSFAYTDTWDGVAQATGSLKTVAIWIVGDVLILIAYPNSMRNSPIDMGYFARTSQLVGAAIALGVWLAFDMIKYTSVQGLALAIVFFGFEVSRPATDATASQQSAPTDQFID